jgi:AcrR family transcriptional regulator
MDGQPVFEPAECDSSVSSPVACHGDRRVERTRRALRTALADLLRTRDYDDLTINDILAEADVGRSTFYAHFGSKDDLLRYGLERLGAELRDASGSITREGGHRFGFVRPLLEHIERQREMLRRLKGRGATVHRRALDRLLTDLTRRAIAGDSAEFDPLRELEVQFSKGALCGMILWWLERNSRLHPHEIEAEFLRLIGNGSAEAAGRRRERAPGDHKGEALAAFP